MSTDKIVFQLSLRLGRLVDSGLVVRPLRMQIQI